MTEDEIKTLVLEELATIAPELEGEQIDPDLNFRDQFELDSLDYLNFAFGLSDKLRLDIPEIDFPKLANISGCLTYLAPKLNN